MGKKYEFSTWQEVLDAQEDGLQEEFSRLKNVANVDEIFPNYKAILERIEAETEQYTEWEEVGEAFTYSQSDWNCEIDSRFRPIVEKWFAGFCERAKNSEYDYTEYIKNFWR